MDTPELRDIAGGEFLMGNDAGRPDEQPAHRVVVRPFRAAVSPVTNAQFALFLADSGVPAPAFFVEERFALPSQPAVGVTWFQAQGYCDWLRGRTGVPFRLPTEAEREFAARGGLLEGDWPWPGERHPLAAVIDALDRPHPPRPQCANAFGLRCMAENVHEWCSDWYSATYYRESARESPVGPPTGKRRASRGGSWRHREKVTRVTARSSLDPGFSYSDFGFRVYADRH